MGILLALLLLLPLAFALGQSDPFEPNKAALLYTGAIALLAGAFHRLVGVVASNGVGGAVRTAWGRMTAWARRDPLSLAIVLFLLSSALSTVLSPRPALGLFGVWSRPAGLLTAAAMTVLFFASRAAAAAPAWLTRIATAVSAAAGVVALYAMVQLAGLDPIPWERTATFDGRWRVPSTMGHPNLLGAYLAISLPLTLRLAWRAGSGPARLGWAVIGGMSLMVVAATLSRGAWLAIAAGAAVGAIVALRGGHGAHAGPAGIARPRLRGRVALAAGAALLLFVMPLWTPLGENFRNRLSQIGDLRAPTSQSRLHLWRAGLRMLASHPLVGVGTDAFGEAFPPYRTPGFWRLEWAASPSKAHNELVQIGATQGGIGLAAALLVVVGALSMLLRIARRREPERRADAAIVGAALAAWAISSATSFSVVATGSLAAVLAGWISGTEGRGAGTEGAASHDRGAGVPGAAGAILLALLLWIPLVLTPWRAATAASRALAMPDAAPQRAEGLARAHDLAPWNDRFAADLGRAHLTRAFAATDPRERIRRLGWARGAFERATRNAPLVAEHRAFLARTIAAQTASAGDDPATARAALRDAYRADSVSATTLTLLEQGYLDAGLVEEGYAVALRCARLYPDFALPMGDLGYAALARGRTAGAIDTLTLALRRNWRGATAAEEAARAARRAALAGE